MYHHQHFLNDVSRNHSAVFCIFSDGKEDKEQVLMGSLFVPIKYLILELDTVSLARFCSGFPT